MSIDPFYFGDRELFGFYHAPDGLPRDSAVLICPPCFGEHLKSYWATKAVANNLAARGSHVLRFDLSNTGNSKGGTRDTSPANWLDDVRIAYRELVEISGVSRIDVVSIRYGSALANLALAEYQVRFHVAWDPCLSGKKYKEFLVSMQQEFVSHYRLKGDFEIGPYEYLGHELSPQFERELEQQTSRALIGATSYVVSTGQREEEDISGTHETLKPGTACPWRSPNPEVMYCHGVVEAICQCF